MVKLRDINVGPVLDRQLPGGFIDRVIKYKTKLSEVENTSIEETVLNFQRDHHPERELQIWEHITKVYQDECKRNPDWKITDKKQHFEYLLGMSLGVNL